MILSDAVKAMRLAVDDVTFDPRGQHYRGAGLHVRQMHLPKGKTSITHRHGEDHLAVLARGACVLTSDEGVATHTSPTCISVKRGVQYAITATDDVVWFCISDISGDDDKLDSLGD